MKCLWCEDPLPKDREGISQFCDSYCKECYEIVVEGKKSSISNENLEDNGGEG